MKKERIKVLEMVEEGKISVDEAAKLLESLKSTGDCGWGPDYEDTEDRLNQFSKNVDQFAKDFSEKCGVMYKEVEPKLKSATKIVLEKTVGLLDEMSRSLNEAASNMDKKVDSGCGCEGEACCDDEPREN